MLVTKDVLLSDVVWYHIGGKVKYLLSCSNRDDIFEAVAFIKKNTITNVICGIGSNLLFPDSYFDGAVIKLDTIPNNPDIHLTKDGYIESFAGELVDSVIQFAFRHNLSGLEWAGGLPGTIGAGVRGNAGAYGGEIKDIVHTATVIDYSGDMPEVKVLTRDELQFVYRGSVIKTHKKMIVVSAQFQLQKATAAETALAKKTYEAHIADRKQKHPLEYPNCGSVFKNIKDPIHIQKVLEVFPDLAEQVETKWYGKVSMAALIEKLGLKGYRVGNAQISEKHALFIINLGGATSADVRSIIKKVQDTCRETFGFAPEPEVEIVG